MSLIKETYPKLTMLIGEKPNSPVWLALDCTRKADEINVPAFHLGGWYGHHA